MPNEPPLGEGNTSRSGEGSMQLLELTELCTKLTDKVTSLEDDLKQTKKIYGKALTKLVKKVKHLDAKLKSTTERRKTRMVISDDEEDLVSDDTSKQGRITKTEYKGFTLQQFTPTKVTHGEEQCQESSEAKLSVLSAAKILADASREKVKTYTRRRSTVNSRDSTVGGHFSTAEEVQDTEVERQDKRIAEETLLQESFKKLRTAEASRCMVCGVHHVSSTRGHDIYMLIEKDYPLSTAVMNLMLSRRLQVEEDSEMAKDLIMKIFIEANKPRR
ncbi:hypothetical protein Tco_0143979 [Tanacetum coccineum]